MGTQKLAALKRTEVRVSKVILKICPVKRDGPINQRNKTPVEKKTLSSQSSAETLVFTQTNEVKKHILLIQIFK